MKAAGWYGVVVGAAMILQWGFFILSGGVPELESEPVRIGFHLAAELMTAAILIISGVGLLRGRMWARPVFLVGVGMLIYTALVSPGYFAQRGEWAFLVMFAVILVTAVVAAAIVARSR